MATECWIRIWGRIMCFSLAYLKWPSPKLSWCFLSEWMISFVQWSLLEPSSLMECCYFMFYYFQRECQFGTFSVYKCLCPACVFISLKNFLWACYTYNHCSSLSSSLLFLLCCCRVLDGHLMPWSIHSLDKFRLRSTLLIVQFYALHGNFSWTWGRNQE